MLNEQTVLLAIHFQCIKKNIDIAQNTYFYVPWLNNGAQEDWNLKLIIELQNIAWTCWDELTLKVIATL